MVLKIYGDTTSSGVDFSQDGGPIVGLNIGRGYDWYYVTLSANTYYQNTSSSPIVIIVNMNTASQFFFASDDGVDGNWTTIGRGDSAQNFYVSAVIPPGNWWHANSFTTTQPSGNTLICANKSLYGATLI